MPSQESVFVDDTRIVDSNDDTNVEQGCEDFTTFFRKERQRREDEKVYIDLTNEETVKSICITIVHIHPGGLRADKYECTIDTNEPFSLLHDDLTTWDTRDDLEFTYKGKLTKDQISKTPIELNMKDGDEVLAQGTIVSREDISVNFMDEDGDVVTIQAKPDTLLCHLLEQYSVQKMLSLVLSQIIFHYSAHDGEPLHYSRVNTLAYCEIASGDIIYVQRKLQDTEGLDNIQIPKVNTHPPESFINQIIFNKVNGSIVDVSHTESGTVWIAEMYYGKDVKMIECTEEDITKGIQLHYTATDGIGKDFVNYFLNDKRQYQTSEVKRLGLLVDQLDDIGDVDELVLSILKLEQEINRSLEFDLLIEPWTRGAYARTEKGISIIRQDLNDELADLSRIKRALLKNKSTKVSKPIIEVGEVVYVSNREGVPERGRVEEIHCSDDIDGYGPSRTYTILFDSEEQVDIEDYQVMLGREYTLSKNIKESDRKGVQHVLDEDSTDPWAREVGWYTVSIEEGIEETFEDLSDALKAYDVNQAQTKGDDLKESDLNLPRDWSKYYKARASGNDEDLEWYGATVKDQIPLTACLIASYKRVKNPFMKAMCKALIISSEPNVMLGGFDLGICWKQAYMNYLEGAYDLLKENLYLFALWHICKRNHINPQRICRLFIAAKGNLDDFLSMVPLIRKLYEAVAENMMNYLQTNKPEEEVNEYMIIQCTNGYTTERNIGSCNRPIKLFLTKYAEDRDISVKSLRVKYKDKTLFISSIGKKTPLDLGIKEDDILEITIMQLQTETTKEQPKQSSPKGKNKKNNNKKKHKKSNKKRPVQIAPPEDLKGEHSKLLGKIHEEADPTFKEIRQRLNAMNLERTKPKQRTSPSKTTAKPKEVVDNPLDDGQLLGGKAGKTQFIKWVRYQIYIRLPSPQPAVVEDEMIL